MAAGHSEELVFTASEDGFELDGVVIRPSGGTTKPLAVVWVHGFTGHFNERFAVHIGRDVAERGFTFVSGNNRGHHIGAGLGTKDGQPVFGGGWWERLDEAPRDVAAWISFAVGLGFAGVALIGHSLGGVKVIAYQAERQDPRVRGVIAASPGVHMHSNAKNASAELRTLAEQLVAEDRGPVLLPWGQLPGGRTLSARTFLSRLNADLDVAGLAIAQAPISRIRCPLFVIAGSEEAHVLTPDDLETMRRNAIASPRVDTRVIDGADHVYHGHESEVAAAFAEWIEALR